MKTDLLTITSSAQSSITAVMFVPLGEVDSCAAPHPDVRPVSQIV